MSETISTSIFSGITLTSPVIITSTGAVIELGAAAAVYDNTGAGTVANNGLIFSDGLSSIYLADGGEIDNKANGSVTGLEAIDILGEGAVTNSGTISGGFLGIYLQAGTLKNLSQGQISGGVVINAGAVVNQGKISSGYGADIRLRGGGSVYNLGTNAAITGVSGTGVDIAGGPGIVVNQGLINSLTLFAGGAVENAGYLGSASDSYGLTGDGAPTSVQNSGEIIAASFGSEASLTNTSIGVISGYQNGIVLSYGGDISNAGTIFGMGGKVGISLGSLMSPPPGLAGIEITNGGVLVNASDSALISGRQEGVSISGSLPSYLTNRGTIIGDIGIDNAGTGNLVLYDTGTITGLEGTAVYFGAGFGRLILGAGAQINGAVIGSDPSDQIVFANGGTIQSISGLSTKFLNITNFSNTESDIVFDAATALAPGATLSNNATIQSDGLLDNWGTIFNTGTIFGPLALGGLYANASPITDPIIVSNAASGVLIGVTGTVIEQNIGGAAATIMNAGLIATSIIGGVAISLTANLANLLVLDAGGTITGKVEGGSAAGDIIGSTLELAAGPGIGTISGIGTIYNGFATIELAQKAIWDVEASSGEIRVGNGADIIISAEAPKNETIELSGPGATLTLVDPSAFAGMISGFGSNGNIELSAVQFNTSYTVTLAPNDILDINTNDETFAFQLDPAGNYAGDHFHLSSNGATGTDITASAVPCFLRGTLIKTPGGDVLVEALQIGDIIIGADGIELSVKWIGKRRYGATHAQDSDIQPILIKASAISNGVPSQDLYLSQLHAVLIDGNHIEANALVNGVSILPTTGVKIVEYFHIETEYHTSIMANNTPVESFIDDDSRRLFDNADEYRNLYPEPTGEHILFGVPRLESGTKLEVIRKRLATRAGVLDEYVNGTQIVGFLEYADRETLSGWAYNPSTPNKPVLLDMLDRGAVIARMLANIPRPDVKLAGFGHGRCGFSITLPAPLPAFQRHEISVRPSGVNGLLQGSPVVLDPGFMHDLVKVGALRQVVGAAIKSIANEQDICELEADLELSANLVRSIRSGKHAATTISSSAAKHRKPTILLIDEHWPTPTRDAGSNVVVSHAKALQAIGYHVIFCAASGAPINTLQADGLLRLINMQVECFGQDGTAAEEVIKRLARCRLDLVYLHRMAIAASYAGLVKHHAPSCRIIYAIADLHHVRLSRQAAVTSRQDLIETAKNARATEFWAMRMADYILTHSSKEASYLNHVSPDISVHIVPWSVDSRGALTDRMHLTDIAFIGGADHAPNVDAVLFLANEILPTVWEKQPKMRCLIIGEGWPQSIFEGIDSRLKVVGHCAQIDKVLSEVRLTVAPLRFGAGIKGKVLESFAAGVPCAMSSIAAEGLNLDSNLEASVSTINDFSDLLLDCYENKNRQTSIALSGRSLLLRQFSDHAVHKAFCTMLS